jgi:hypothetical protein
MSLSSFARPALSTEQLTIKDLKVDPQEISFEMIPYPLAPDRPLKFVASLEKMTNRYTASAIGLWTNLFDQTRLVKIEWKQIPSIKLPYSIIGN